MLRSSRRPCVQQFLAQRCQELSTQVQEVLRPASSCQNLRRFAAASPCRGIWAVSKGCADAILMMPGRPHASYRDALGFSSSIRCLLLPAVDCKWPATCLIHLAHPLLKFALAQTPMPGLVK